MPASPAPPARALERDDKIRFKDADGALAFVVQFRGERARLLDSELSELARFRVDARGADLRVEIRAEDETLLGAVVRSATGWRVVDGSGITLLYTLRRADMDEWEFQDADDRLASRILEQDYGFEIKDRLHQTTARVKATFARTSLRDPDDETRLYTSDRVSRLGMACFALERLNRSQQTALFLALTLGRLPSL